MAVKNKLDNFVGSQHAFHVSLHLSGLPNYFVVTNSVWPLTSKQSWLIVECGLVISSDHWISSCKFDILNCERVDISSSKRHSILSIDHTSVCKGEEMKQFRPSLIRNESSIENKGATARTIAFVPSAAFLACYLNGRFLAHLQVVIASTKKSCPYSRSNPVTKKRASSTLAHIVDIAVAFAVKSKLACVKSFGNSILSILLFPSTIPIRERIGLSARSQSTHTLDLIKTTRLYSTLVHIIDIAVAFAAKAKSIGVCQKLRQMIQICPPCLARDYPISKYWSESVRILHVGNGGRDSNNSFYKQRI